MCMIEDSEPFDVWLRDEIVARRLWACVECAASIEPGEPYVRYKSLYEGRWDRYPTCRACDDGPIWWLREHCNGWCPRGVEQDLRDHWDDGYPLPGEGRLDLGRLIVGMRQRRTGQRTAAGA